MKQNTGKGFSLVEVMVVVSTVSVVMAATMPAMNKVRAHARAIVCRSNLRQLVLANLGYADEHDGFCVPAAEDYWQVIGFRQGGYKRWHGVRDGNDMPFDPLRGPLAEYLGDGQIKECPARVNFTKDRPGDINFEISAGGYGYNMAYLGSRLSKPCPMTIQRRYAETPRMAEIKRPQETLMFADTAMAREQGVYIEYSFAEAPFVVTGGRVYEGYYTSPSIHFRHPGKNHTGAGGGSANVGWADAHIEPRPMACKDLINVYGVSSASMNIGWFEPVNNTLFDLK